MKQPSISEGIVVALIASFLGSVAYLSLASIFSNSFTVRLLISGFTLFYILYLLSRTKEKIGRFSIIVIWAMVSSVMWLMWPAITLFIVVNLGMVWLVRSLYFYSSLFSSLADLLLNLLSIATAVWAFSYSGSLFLTIWCFFLIQALFVLIPKKISKKQSLEDQSKSDQRNNHNNFQQAYREAEAAVRKLSTH